MEGDSFPLPIFGFKLHRPKGRCFLFFDKKPTHTRFERSMQVLQEELDDQKELHVDAHLDDRLLVNLNRF